MIFRTFGARFDLFLITRGDAPRSALAPGYIFRVFGAGPVFPTLVELRLVPTRYLAVVLTVSRSGSES